MKKNMLSQLRNKLPWILLAGLGVFLVSYFLLFAKVQLGGDIVEYHGMTQSLMYSSGVHLEPSEQESLEQVLHKAYFSDPGYYVTGRDNNRYPVHFFFYSLISVPLRLILKITQMDELKTLWMTNIASFLVMIAILWKWFVKNTWSRIVLLVITFLSPFMSFFIWPGPDLWYLCVLLIGTFAFFEKKFLLSAALIALASWHSQPLIILSALTCIVAIAQESTIKISKKNQLLALNTKTIALSIIIGLAALVPYTYNLYAFSALTPWTDLKDGWTQLNGFGVHNMSVWKLYEQLFDLNIGQFWYAPILFISSFVLIIWKSVKREWLYPLATLLFTITAFFYQTNPGWHYGTSGYGPGRHGLLFLPLVIFFTFQVLRKMSVKTFLLLLIIAGVQLGILSTNNFLEPDLTKTLHHSVFAKSVLNTYPQFYNPTPEIFQDRTNHTDITFPTTAIYRNSEGKCIKAYVLQSDIEAVKDECGSFIEPDSIFENEFIRIANYPRKVVTSQATFWPYSDACAEWFVPTADKNFSCPQTLGEFMVQTGIQNPDLISTVPEFPYPGIWKINSDQPILITVPAGYIIHHNSFDGVYVHF